MIIPIPSGGRRFRLKIRIIAKVPFSLVARGYDASVPNSFYFRRRIPIKEPGKKEVEIPLPLSPDILSLQLVSNSDRTVPFSIEEIKAEPLPASMVWEEEEMHAFIRFAMNFAQQAGYLGTGYYSSPDERFLIEYLPYIKDEFGEQQVTPARTNRYTGRIQASQSQFQRFTIPVRFFILLHERYHYQIPTRKEKPADLHALRVFLDLGFSQTEGMYALSKVFLSHPDTLGMTHGKRVKDVINFIDWYRAQHKVRLDQAA
jgi:hypothetical protein